MILLALSACLPDLGARSVQAHADRCAECHPVHAEAFAGSRHARSDTSAVFLRLRDQAESELGAAAFCDGCHRPSGTPIACVTCHDASGNLSTSNGALVHDPTGPVRGPSGETSGPHASTRGDFLTDSALCGTCHEVSGVAGFEEHPFSAWQASPAAAGGDRCQDCHMPTSRGPWVEDGQPRELSDHRFDGLATDPIALLRRGLTLQAVPEGVELENHAGHVLPDGASFSRELWLESKIDGRWTGDRRPLHAGLFANGLPTWNPVWADETRIRGVPAGEVRFEPFEASTVCVRFRPIAEDLALGLELPVPEAQTVVCSGEE